MRRSGRTWYRGVPAGAVVIVGCLLAGPAFAAGVEGQVFDGDGRPLAGVVVRAVQVPPPPILPAGKGGASPGEPLEIARTRTDRAGFFHLELAGWRPRGRIQVLVGDRGPWDPVRYARPAPRDVTRDLRRGRDPRVSIRVPDAPGWPELRSAIERAGGSRSPLGRLLRRHGFPRRILADASGRLVYDFGEERHVVRAGEAGPGAARPRPAAELGGRGR